MLSRLLSCMVMIAACAPQTRILVGNVVTLAPERPRAEALAIRDGRIAALGTLAEVRASLPGAAVLDLRGQTILPGLADAHGHLRSLGRKLAELDLTGAQSYDELVRLAALRARRLPPGAWLLGRGWDQTRWPGSEFPNHDALSRAVPDRPALLRRVDGHAALANARAFAHAGITRATTDPPGGRILRGPDGSPSGVLIDTAMDLVRVPPFGADQIRGFLRSAARACAEVGLTQVHDMGMEREDVAALRELAARGELPLRVVVYRWAGNEKELDAALADAVRDGSPGSRIHLRGVKMIADGAMGSRGAALGEPYADDPAHRGLLLWTEEALVRAVARVAARGLQPAVHAIGDRAVALTLRAFAALPRSALPPRIEHLQLLPQDGIGLLRASGAVASMQPTHATSDMRWAEKRLGPERVRRAYAWRAVLAAGVTLAFGSDFPVESANPLAGLYAAETRQDGAGWPEGGWQPEERIGREAALRAFTEGAAAAAGLAGLGRIFVGARADLSVFDRDISRVPAGELLRARALRTFIDGEEVAR